MGESEDSYRKMGRFKGDEIVISGISGRFPNADDISQFSENLYNKVDMISKSDEYSYANHPELPQHRGKIKGMEKFDSQFFRVTHWQAATLDPPGRKMMEEALSAFFDAGINPETLKDLKLGVFIGAMQTDSGTLSLYNVFKRNGFVISGTSKTMFANRISYWIDGKGPSYGLDAGCSGSMAALELAYNRMKTGEIDCALVGGCNLCIHPVLDVNMKRAGLLCLDGKTKCFDKSGDGYVRSEAISIYFLQKAKDAKRIYSEVYHVKGKYFASPDDSFSPTRNPKDLEKFFEEFYSEIDVSPKDVEYIEANAFGIVKADGSELEAIGNVFGKVKIGSVKSNMGNTEAASGACSVTKMCLAYQKGRIPANLHYNEPQNHIPAVKDGRLQVVTEHAPFNRKFTAINNFCFTGSNFHTLLKGHYKPKDSERYKSTIPRLVLISGRHEESVNKMLDILETNPIDPEQYALLNNFFKYNVPGYTGRGYTILDSDDNKETVSLSRGFEFYSGNTRQLWFLYSGMGSQWAGMGEGLLRLPVFAAAIERCHKVLLPKGVDIIKIITDKDSGSLNILNSLLAITAIQIGLTDVLKSLGIIPDNIIGHSVGEIASAYADGALTTEQTILSSYSRAIVSYKTKFIKGKMAAVGLGQEEVNKLVPPEIQVVCHNSSESVTISGPADIVTEFLKSLTEKGIFAREVASSNIAFHSRYIAKAGPKLLALQKQFITEPKLRSNKWLSTSYPPEDWHKPESKYASADYFTHNLLNSVLFEEAARFIPSDAIIVEIAPHGLLQAIMKRSHKQCTNLSLTRRGEKDSVKLLLETIGILYQTGVNVDVDTLYPKVEFPVSTETPVLSHFIGWEHSVDWPEDKYNIEKPKITTSKEFIISIHDDDYGFLKDHIRNDVNVLPEAAMLVFVWETLAEYKGIDYRYLSVVFDDLKFYSEIVINSEETLRLNVTIQSGSSRFEITNDDNIVAGGFINTVKKISKKYDKITFSETETHINQNDIYTIMSLKGYSYVGEFQSITSLNIGKNKATIKWNDNWTTFLDSIIHFNALSKSHDGISTVKLINKLTINVDDHRILRSTAIDGVSFYNALVLEDIGDTICGGVIAKDIVFNHIPKIEITSDILQIRAFVPHVSTNTVDIQTALQVNLQVIYENITGDIIKMIEIVPNEKVALKNKVEEIANKILLIKVEIKSVDTKYTVDLDDNEVHTANLIIFHNFLENYELVQEITNAFDENTFILAIEKGVINVTSIKNMTPVTTMHVENQTLILLKKANTIDTNTLSVISSELDLALIVHKLEKEQQQHILLVVEKYPELSLKGVLKEIKRHGNIYLLIIDANAPKFSVSNNYYKEQIQKGLKVNMLKNGQWGSYYYIPTNAQNNIVKNVKLIAKEQGNIESLSWIESPQNFNKQTIQVCYAGLSTKDCQKLSNTIDNTSFGMDFSGIDSRGNRVMGLLPDSAMAGTVEADYDLLWPVPQSWSLAEAATVPLSYTHAFYCLYVRSYLEPHSNVFINGAAGALGQAVISIALSAGCTVFATVGSVEKKNFLLRLFPELNEKNIGNTYDISFRDMVITRSNNKCCSIVINCGSGATRKNAMGCVGAEKYFLDVNDNDRKENKKFTMSYMWDMKSYAVVNMSSIFSEKYYENKKKLQTLLSEGIAKGFVRPLTSVVFTPLDISRAFQLLSFRNNRGRVLINMKESVTLKDNFKVTSRITLHSSKTYVVVSDGTELGTELMEHLIQRGARRLLLHCNPKLMNGYFHVKYASWSKLNVSIEFSSDDLQTELSCQNLVRSGKKLGSIDGIFITQSDQANRCVNIIDQENFDAALLVSYLDKASRVCSDLRYFAVIAATSRNVSNEYVLEEIEKCCSLRNELGLPSLFIRHTVNDKKLQSSSLSALFNAMESSLTKKYVSVLTNDIVDINVDKLMPSKLNTNFQSGLGAFFSHILEDEFTATEAIVPMKTKKSFGYEYELLLNPEDTYLMMIPGIEGNYKVLTSISERLKTSAITLQLGPNLDESIPEMARKLLNYVKARQNLKSPFYLMGYSFGVNIALELAALLEKEGLVGVVYCLDSSPDAMRVHLDAYIGNLTNEQLQNSLIEHIFKLLSGHDSNELLDILEGLSKWSDKIELFTSKVKKYVSYTHQYLRSFLQVAYNRIIMAKEYKPKFDLESELVLIKGIAHPNAEQMNNDYNLHKYTKKPVQVFVIEADHGLAPFDCRVSNFINKTLAP